MIVFCEGPRHSGKTHLIDSFFANNKNPDVIYYKFKFAKYIDEFGMKGQEIGAGVHYFSIGNILTILELNETLLKDKIVIFDRCIYSAYVWSIYRNRLDRETLLLEFEKILNSSLYSNCTLLYIDREKSIEVEKRNKDYFGNFEDREKEAELFGQLFDKFYSQATDSNKNNSFVRFTNNFDLESTSRFTDLLASLVKQK
jgi:thymidylate kinase